MLRRLLLTLFLSAALAVVAFPAAAQLHHHRPMARSWVPGSNIRPHPAGDTEGQKVEWWLPLVEAIPTLLFMFGAVPGIIANSKGIPYWKSYFWRGLFFGFLFFPIVMILIYQVMKYEPEPIYNQAQIRPPNIAVPQTARSDGIPAAADIPPPVSFQPENNP
jgi:hypothetical protein